MHRLLSSVIVDAPSDVDEVDALHVVCRRQTGSAARSEAEEGAIVQSGRHSHPTSIVRGRACGLALPLSYLLVSLPSHDASSRARLVANTVLSLSSCFFGTLAGADGWARACVGSLTLGVRFSSATVLKLSHD